MTKHRSVRNIIDSALIALLTAWLLFDPGIASGGFWRVWVYSILILAIVHAVSATGRRLAESLGES